MTEVEAYGLREDDEVVVRRPGGRSYYGFVIKILPYDLTPARAMEMFGFNELDARHYSFDGPIILINVDGYGRYWAPAHVQRAPVEVHCACRSCSKVLVINVPYLSYREMVNGAEIKNVQLEQDVRELLEAQLCGKCSKVAKKRILQW